MSTEPEGAIPSFDGLPVASCSKTPCKAELREGKVRIIAALEQYETADTAISLARNNQSASIKLKPKFGTFEAKPAYLDGIGMYEQWNLSINNSPHHLGEEIRLNPNQYSVKISHRCYEDIDFKLGIEKGKHEVFDLAGHAKLKKGGLDLRAERGGQPEAEPVYINGKLEGETPFSGIVPLCAEIEAGGKRINANLKHNEKVSHIAKLESREYAPEARIEAKEAYGKAERRGAFLFGGGAFMNLNSIDPLYKPIGGYISAHLAMAATMRILAKKLCQAQKIIQPRHSQSEQAWSFLPTSK